MYIIEKIIKIYLKTFNLRPRIISTIIFIPFLYIIGWLLAKPLIYISIDSEKISLIGTIFTFILFTFLLPKWFEIRWGIKNIWERIGLKKGNKKESRSLYFLKGLICSIFLMSLILTPIVFSQWGIWLGKVKADIFINSLCLIIGVGFAEELIFRGWLLEDLKNQFGIKKAIIFQAAIFSIIHIGFDIPLWEMICILGGLFILGILLALIRLIDGDSLWGSIGLHGGLVGLWFLANNGLIEISNEAPKWLVGPGNFTTNPLGGSYGITILLALSILLGLRYQKTISQKFNKY